jgi:hypothetical protein
MTAGQQVALAISPTVIPTLTVLVALVLNSRQFDAVNKRMDDLRLDMLRELEHSRVLFTEQLRRIEDVWTPV